MGRFSRWIHVSKCGSHLVADGKVFQVNPGLQVWKPSSGWWEGFPGESRSPKCGSHLVADGKFFQDLLSRSISGENRGKMQGIGKGGWKWKKGMKSKTRQPVLIFPTSCPNATFLGCAPGGCDPQIRTRPRFSCNASTPKFHHPMFTRSEVIMLTNKQTNRRRWKHPTLFATLRRWVKSDLPRKLFLKKLLTMLMCTPHTALCTDG